MSVSRIINRRTAVLGLLLVILATAGFGFAAQNTVPESRAGDGEEMISGYTVTNIDYNLDVSDPTRIASVSFTLAGTNPGAVLPDEVKVKLQATGGTWEDCGAAVGATMPANFTCTVDVAALDADEFRIVAAQ